MSYLTSPLFQSSKNQQSYSNKIITTKPKFSLEKNNDFKILVVSWNMMGKLPEPKTLEILLPSERTKADMIIIGTQQCQTSLLMSFFCKSKKCWEKMLCDYMAQRRFKALDSQKLHGLHIMAFVKQNKVKYVSSLKSKKVKTGWYGFMGNKGAVTLNIRIGQQPFLFINTHLPSSHNEFEDRNDHLLQIIEKLVSKEKKENVILFGDMNYRLNVSREESRNICAMNQNKQLNYHLFSNKDQLNQQKELQFFLKIFQQQVIHFPPTYKLSVDDNTYDHNRITGWTDRIFYYNGGIHKVRQDQYYSDMYVLGSDHRPVFGSFVTKFDENQIVSSQNREPTTKGYRFS